MKNKIDVCYCATCQHKKASECVSEHKCGCCIEADKIRLTHPVVPGEVEEARAEEEEEMEKEFFTQADPDVI
jgi:hypothetical protein